MKLNKLEYVAVAAVVSLIAVGFIGVIAWVGAIKDVVL